jgi:hypothetical protein
MCRLWILQRVLDVSKKGGNIRMGRWAILVAFGITVSTVMLGKGCEDPSKVQHRVTTEGAIHVVADMLPDTTFYVGTMDTTFVVASDAAGMLSFGAPDGSIVVRASADTTEREDEILYAWRYFCPPGHYEGTRCLVYCVQADYCNPNAPRYAEGEWTIDQEGGARWDVSEDQVPFGSFYLVLIAFDGSFGYVERLIR